MNSTKIISQLQNGEVAIEKYEDNIISNSKANEFINLDASVKNGNDANNKETLDNNLISDDKQNLIKCEMANECMNFNISAAAYSKNNSFESDYFDSIINSSQMTSDISLSNIILDNLSTFDLKIENTERYNDHYENEDNLIDLDEFEKYMKKELKDLDVEDIVDKFVIDKTYENHSKDGKSNETNTNTEKFDKSISKPYNSVDDVLTISSEEDLNLLDDLDVISISSQESNNFTQKKVETFVNDSELQHIEDKILNTIPNQGFTESIDETSCSSYDSSDFEFITEEEAQKQCLLNLDINDNNETLKTVEIKYSRSQNSGPSCTVRNIEITEYSSNTAKDPDSQKGNRNDVAGPSYNLNRNFSEAVARYQNYNLNMINNRNYRTNHVVPAGEEYFDLFQGIFAPTIPFMIENKSTRSANNNVQYEGIGFDMRTMRRGRDSDDEFAKEAKETSKKILSMYPDENRRKRRRF